jgi:hypothetical protein
VALGEVEAPPGSSRDRRLLGRLDEPGIDHTPDLFEGTRMGIPYRYPGSTAEPAGTLVPGFRSH